MHVSRYSIIIIIIIVAEGGEKCDGRDIANGEWKGNV